MKAKRTAPPPITTEGFIALLREITAEVEANGVTTMTPYRLTAAVRMSLTLADARLRVDRLPPE